MRDLDGEGSTNYRPQCFLFPQTLMNTTNLICVLFLLVQTLNYIRRNETERPGEKKEELKQSKEKDRERKRNKEAIR